MLRLAFATSNIHKARELESILRDFKVDIEVVQVKLREIQSDHLEDIATHCCEEAYRILGRPVFVEDSGLFINSLNGFPGPYSSYVYRTIGIPGILKLMEGSTDRDARFESCIACKIKDDVLKIFKGVCKGRISYEPRGSMGFGFDPIFIPYEGDGRTFGEMTIEEKNKLSHRGIAGRAFATWLKDLLKL